MFIVVLQWFHLVKWYTVFISFVIQFLDFHRIYVYQSKQNKATPTQDLQLGYVSVV
mgnify:CR=1 FL=1